MSPEMYRLLTTPPSPEMLEARVARLAGVAEAARALLAALPKCCVCDARATREDGDPYETAETCDAHGHEGDAPLPHALERALDAAVAAALAGEP